MNIESIFQLSNKEYPERKRTTIVITDEGDNIAVGVKAVARVYEAKDGGAFSVNQMVVGEYIRLKRDDTLDALFNSIKMLFDTIPEIIDKTTNNGDQA